MQEVIWILTNLQFTDVLDIIIVAILRENGKFIYNPKNTFGVDILLYYMTRIQKPIIMKENF